MSTGAESGGQSDLPDGLEAPRRHWAAATLMLALTIAVLDASMVNVALPAIARELGIAPGQIVWIVIAYSLVVVVSLLPLSAVAERIGFRRMFAIGLTLFMVSSIGSASAGGLLSLTISRMMQGLGGAMLMCLFGGLVRNIYPNRKLGVGLSLNAMTVGIMAVLGPTAGAFLLQMTSWHWIFLLTIPLCLLAYAGIRFLPDVPRSKSRFDWTACALSVPVFGLSIFGLDALVRAPTLAALCLLSAGLVGWVLVRRSLGQAAPLVPVDLLRITPIAYAVGASVFSFAAQMAAFVAVPFYFQHTLGYSYADVGVLLGAWSIGVAVMAPVAGYLSGRYAVAVLCGIGAGVMALGLLGVLLLSIQASFLWFILVMLAGGTGFGFFQTPNNRAMLAGAPRYRSGAAGGMQATTRVFGQTLGTTLVGLSFNLAGPNGARLGLGAAMACALIALIINIVRHRNPVADLEL
ncbi:MFS transporter [Pusillimonas sp. MFBS29]|uniref:MFS transporter n=1 Tax=Pusillimonas sp. MFBS29 TaxID=2886690 RepID=UPI001D101B03|nr:MFS transporter [Pusillimonas sp. MFBS29]MCC2595928.1 MFS transporter [Pusillimonas sp. MFBS29]